MSGWSTESQINVPLCTVEPTTESLLNFIPDYYDDIIAKLNQHGAVLFRGFACIDQDYFSKAIQLCGLGERLSTADYDFPRTILHKDVYTSSDLPGDVVVNLHHEKPRSKEPPHHIYFCCITPPEKKGGTIFANAAAIWRDIPKSIQDKIAEHGVVYQQYFHRNTSQKYRLLKKILGQKGLRSWQEYYLTNDKQVVEDKLALGEATWSWVNGEEDLKLKMPLPGVRQHPLTQEMLWFNSSAYSNNYAFKVPRGLKHTLQRMANRYIIAKDELSMVCHYGNGQAFSAREITTINEVLDLHSKVLRWQKGDFMIVDNFTFMHAPRC